MAVDCCLLALIAVAVVAMALRFIHSRVGGRWSLRSWYHVRSVAELGDQLTQTSVANLVFLNL